MSVQKQFNDLHGSKVSRAKLKEIIEDAKKANETEIIYRLSTILLNNKDTDVFEMSLKKYPTTLNAPRHKGAYKQALREDGRLRKGWKFDKGGVFKVVALDKKTKQFKMTLNGKTPCKTCKKLTCSCKKKR
ncbi:hypothetical protein [Tenacibaculum maritimum]|uniref:hypothetical protein n=1 Tax=Tenacibaculum maritimum TaxID=107401 RepID=UPI00387666DA